MKFLKTNQRGSVSIFLLIILLAVFFFNAVLIDYARVMVAMSQAESNLKSGMRSVLSGYDVELKEIYGVYATTEAEKQEMLADLLQINSEQTPGFFHLLDLQYDSSSIQLQFDRPLGNSIVFEHQILEEMKYKAPIDFTFKLIDKFSPISLELGESSSTVKALKDVKDLYEDREKELRSILENQQLGYDLIQKSMKDLMTTQERIGQNLPSYVSALEDLLYYSNLQPKDEEEEEEIEEIIKNLKSTIQAYRQNGTEQLEQLQGYIEQHNRSIEQAIKHLEQSISLNKQIKQRVDLARSNQQDPYDVIRKTGDSQIDYNTSNAEQISEVKQSLHSMILQDSFFEELELNIQEQNSLLDDIRAGVQGFKNAFQLVYIMESSNSSLETKLIQNKDRLVDLIDDYSSKGSTYVTSQKKTIDEVHEDREKSKELEEQYEEEAKQTKQEIYSLLQRIKDLEGNKEEFEAVDRLFQDYVTINEDTETELQENDHMEDSSPDEFGAAAMQSMDSLFSNLGGVASSFRDELYINEYTLARFNHFDPQNLKNLGADDTLSSSLSLQDQEVEYILYGFIQPSANIAAAFSEIFTFRLAINTIDAFVQCARTGHPLAVFACVLSRAFYQTFEDIKQLISGREIKLTKRLPILLTYQDHLRLFLYFHSRTDQVYRIQALIHHWTGKDLKNMFTYVGSEAETSFRLWFLPGIIKAIQYTGAIGGKVHDGRYYITNQAYLSY